tara:strand:+ start:296 stop:415 length:120 start_codon:yes stop_codon:yes gene_type:complete
MQASPVALSNLHPTANKSSQVSAGVSGSLIKAKFATLLK